MSFVTDRVRYLDGRIDRISLSPLVARASDGAAEAEEDGDDGSVSTAAALSSPRVTELLRIAKALSCTSSSKVLLPAARIRGLILQSGLTSSTRDDYEDVVAAKSVEETEVEWLLVSKATLQVYGLMFHTLLDEILPLSDDIWYWDEVVNSHTYSSLYAIQTSPLRLWDWSRDVFYKSKTRLQRMRGSSAFGVFESGGPSPGLSERWRRFYGIVRESMAERSLTNIQRKILSPVALCRAQAKEKQTQLKKLRNMTASGLGVLIDEALSFGADDEAKEAKTSVNETDREWKGFVERSVSLMDHILKGVVMLDTGVTDFEHRVFRSIEDDPDLSVHADDVGGPQKPAILAQRLIDILEGGLPAHSVAVRQVVQENGRPSRAVRYWLPTALLLLSSSTILRILINRQEDLLRWVADFGATVQGFWFNWVIEPLRKVVGTIRHDSTSEIAIMSRDSLRADRESLERMVVEFARERPELAVGSTSVTDVQIADIRAKVREGDVTPVLRAYENELKSPLVNAVRGDLVRSLLIQVQKTKVDLETAIGGIDALLRSQELVFGFVGLTPGVLVSVGVFQYLRAALGGRKGIRRGERAVRAVRVLRNIDRIFADASPSEDNLLPYKDYGLLVCEIHVLCKLIRGVLPADVEKEFLEDLDDVANVKGITAQMRAFDRIRWAYAKWLR